MWGLGICIHRYLEDVITDTEIQEMAGLDGVQLEGNLELALFGIRHDMVALRKLVHGLVCQIFSTVSPLVYDTSALVSDNSELAPLLPNTIPLSSETSLPSICLIGILARWGICVIPSMHGLFQAMT